MSKKIANIVLILFFLTILVAPVQAQAVGPLSFFSNITQSVQNKWQRFFLRLPGNKSGLVVLQQSFAAMSDVKSLMLDGEITATVKNNDVEAGTFNAKIAGPVMVEDIRTPHLGKQDLTISGKAVMQGSSYPFGLEMKSDKSVVYFKLSEVPGVPGLPTDGWVNHWFKVDQSKMVGSETQVQPETLNPEKIAQLQTAFLQLLKDADVSDARRETVEGRGVFVVDVTITNGALMTYLKTVNKIVSPESESTDPQMWDRLSEQSSPIKEIKLSLTVDRSTLYLSQAVYDVALDMSSSTPATAMMPEIGNAGALSAGIVQLRIRMGMSDFNKQFDFSVPQDAKDFQEMMMGAFGQMMGGSALPSGAEGFPGMGVNSALPAVGKMNPKLKAGSAVDVAPTTPGSMPKLTPDQEKMLKQYGINPDEL